MLQELPSHMRDGGTTAIRAKHYFISGQRRRVRRGGRRRRAWGGGRRRRAGGAGGGRLCGDGIPGARSRGRTSTKLERLSRIFGEEYSRDSYGRLYRRDDRVRECPRGKPDRRHPIRLRRLATSA